MKHPTSDNVTTLAAGVVLATCTLLVPDSAHAEVNVCQELLFDLVVPPTMAETLECTDNWAVCLALPHCCIPGVCNADPVCLAAEYVPVPGQTYQAGDIICDLDMPPEGFVDRLSRGLIANIVDLQLFGLPTALASGLQQQWESMELRAVPLPPSVQELLLDLRQPLAGMPAAYNELDVQDVLVLPDSEPDAELYLIGGAQAITLGRVVVIPERYYTALLEDSAGVRLDEYVRGAVSGEFLAAVDLMVHELVHVRQYRENGDWTFVTNYLLEQGLMLVTGAPSDFEVEAYEFGANVADFHDGWYCRASSRGHEGERPEVGLTGQDVDCYTSNVGDFNLSAHLDDESVVEGELWPWDSYRFFVMELEAGQGARVELKTMIEFGDLDLYIYPPSGESFTSTTATDDEVVLFEAEATGLHLVLVVANPGDDGGHYDLTVDRSDWMPIWEGSFSDANQWASGVEYYSTIRYPDVDGDGRDDVCGRGGPGIWCATSTGTSFSNVSLWSNQYSDWFGWSGHPRSYSTIRFPDLNGDGRDDICGRGGNGIRCAVSSGGNFGVVSTWASAFSNAWNSGPENYGTIDFPDLDGDGRADVCGRGPDGIQCALSNGLTFGQVTLWTPEFRDDHGWANGPEYYSTILFPDVNGDGRADVCGRGGAGLWCATSTGSSFGPISHWTDDYSDDDGWHTDPAYYSTLQFGDVDGDGRDDVCARGSWGMFCSRSSGANFWPAELWTDQYKDDGGGDRAEYYRTLTLTDVNGDGLDDLCGRGRAGARCQLSNGDDFEDPVLMASEPSDDEGWDVPYYYATLRWADVDGDGRTEPCGRSPEGIRCAH